LHAILYRLLFMKAVDYNSFGIGSMLAAQKAKMITLLLALPLLPQEHCRMV